MVPNYIQTYIPIVAAGVKYQLIIKASQGEQEICLDENSLPLTSRDSVDASQFFPLTPPPL